VLAEALSLTHIRVLRPLRLLTLHANFGREAAILGSVLTTSAGAVAWRVAITNFSVASSAGDDVCYIYVYLS
jgi:hypothetical protein